MKGQAKLFDNQDGELDDAIALIIDLLNDGKREWHRIKTEMARIGTNL